MYEDIEYSVDGRTALISFNRPHKLNAVRRQTYLELFRALDEAERDDRVRSVIFTGKGRGFCAGADLDTGFVPSREGDPVTGENVRPDIGGTATLRLFDMRKPLIGAVNGPAIGFGATFLLPMDFRIASTTARFGYVFTRRAIVAESCSSWFLPRIVGMPTALDWMLTGRIFEAAEAKAAGLVRDVVEAEALLPAAFAIADEIASTTSPASVAFNRQLIWRMQAVDHPRIAHDYESRALAFTFRAADSAESTRAFHEKRPPNFVSTVADTAFTEQWWPRWEMPKE